MIIQCEECKTKFRVSDSEIQDNGRFVRCSNCEHEWVAYPPEKNGDQGIETKPPLNPFALNIKVEAQRKAERNAQSSASSHTFSSFLITALCVLIIASGVFVMGVVLLDKEKGSAFSSMPISNFFSSYLNHDLKITNVVLDVRHKEASAYEVNFKVSIYNSGAKEQKLNQLRLIMFDENKSKIKEVVITYHESVKAGHHYTVHEAIKDIPVEAMYFSVDFGEPLELLLRPALFLISVGDYE